MHRSDQIDRWTSALLIDRHNVMDDTGNRAKAYIVEVRNFTFVFMSSN